MWWRADRSRGIDDVRLDVHEDEGCVGPTKGCAKGCLMYYCCCRGVAALCCNSEHAVNKPGGEEKYEQVVDDACTQCQSKPVYTVMWASESLTWLSCWGAHIHTHHWAD
jgi:hypothetical protein